MMNNLKVIKVLPLQSGTSERGEWRSQEVIVEQVADVQYPDRFLLRLTGSAIDQMATIKEGMIVSAHWACNVRQFKTKNGTDAYQQELRCWRISQDECPNNMANQPEDKRPF